MEVHPFEETKIYNDIDLENMYPDENICRICLENDYIERLIFPCKCRGTAKFVHEECIAQWISTTTNIEAKKQCMQCLYKYKFQKKIEIPCKCCSFFEYNILPILIYQMTILFSISWFITTKYKNINFIDLFQVIAFIISIILILYISIWHYYYNIVTLEYKIKFIESMIVLFCPFLIKYSVIFDSNEYEQINHDISYFSFSCISYIFIQCVLCSILKKTQKKIDDSPGKLINYLE